MFFNSFFRYFLYLTGTKFILAPAWREGDKERWNYYFGNLDIFRMPANSEIQKEFIPEKKWLRIDPIDNQRGEFEYEDHGLRFSQVDVSQELISMEDIEK